MAAIMLDYEDADDESTTEHGKCGRGGIGPGEAPIHRGADRHEGEE